MSRQDARRILIAYDISDDVRRARLAERLSRYGDRIQYSVFVADLGAASLIRLRAHIREIIDAHDDSVLICDLGLSSNPRSEPEQLGSGRPVTTSASYLV